MGDLSRERIAELVEHMSGSLGTGASLNYGDTMALLSMASRAVSVETVRKPAPQKKRKASK